MDKNWPKWRNPAVSVLRKWPWRGEVWKAQSRPRWDSKSRLASSHFSAFTALMFITSCLLGGIHTQVPPWWLPFILWPSQMSRSLQRGRAAQTLEPPSMMDSAGSEARATNRCSVPVWAMVSAVRNGVSIEGQDGPGSQWRNATFCLCSLLPLLFVQRLGARYMVGTQMASRVCSPSFSWGRPTTLAPQMGVQMGSSGALQPQTIRETSSTLSVLRRMVRLRKRYSDGNFTL